MEDRKRGQVGIGTLVVFIAMVIVAAIAAGVLVDTAGFLQGKSEAAGQQSGEQVTNRLTVVSATGSVSEANNDVVDVELTVKLSPGASPVDMRNVSVTWVESTGTYRLVDDSVYYTSTNADGRFLTAPAKDSDGSSPVLNDPDDRFILVFDLDADPGVGNVQSGSSTDDEYEWEGSLGSLQVGDSFLFSSHLQEGRAVGLRMTTKSGATTMTRLIVPETLSGTEAVTL